MKTCKHETPQWHLADCNEDGWKCAECEYALGFRPDFDREHTLDKVETILFWLHEHDFHYVSNASEGDCIANEVAAQCHKIGAFDQQTIVYLIAALGLGSHQKFWRKEAAQFLCSHPARTIAGDVARCDACGYEAKQQAAGPLFDSTEPF